MSFLGARLTAPSCDTLLSRPKPHCVKAHLCDSDLELCRRWVRPRKKKKERDPAKKKRKEKKKWRRNFPWYSLKFSSTATPPPTLLFFTLPLSLSSICSNSQRLALLPACLPASPDCPWSFWWIHKTSCILDWDGAVTKTRVMGNIHKQGGGEGSDGMQR